MERDQAIDLLTNSPQDLINAFPRQFEISSVTTWEVVLIFKGGLGYVIPMSCIPENNIQAMLDSLKILNPQLLIGEPDTIKNTKP